MIQHLKIVMDKFIQYYQKTGIRVYGYVQIQRQTQVYKQVYICTGIRVLGK